MSEFKKGDQVRVIDRFSAFEGQLGMIFHADPSVVSVKLESGNTLSRSSRTARLDLELIDTNPAAAQIQGDLNATIKSLGGEPLVRSDNGADVPEPEAVDYVDDRWEKVRLTDPVNHPSHYTSSPASCSGCGTSIECIEITRHRNFDIGSAFKYLWRAGLKEDATQDPIDKQVEDLKKAIWYIQDEIKRITK